MSKLDSFVGFVDSKTEKRIKVIYTMTVSDHIPKSREDDEKDKIFDELMYFLLNDFMLGCEVTARMHEYNNEIEHLKDIISICKQSTVIMNLAQSLQELRIDLNTSLKNISELEKNHLERFMFLGLVYQDSRYIENLVDHLIDKEDFDVEFFIQFINKKIMAVPSSILVLNDNDGKPELESNVE